MPRPGDLIAFDVDGTLVDHPEGKVVWQLLNRRFIGDDRVNEERFAMLCRGEISYSEWVDLDVGGWQRAGATRAQIIEALAELKPVDGARETLSELRRRGYRLALISGTLDVTLERCLPGLEVEAAHMNRLHFDDDGRIGGWSATPYDHDGKARCLAVLAEERGLALERCAFVGDNVNDVGAARAAGFSIAWNPRSQELEDVATVSVRATDLRTILGHFPGAV